VPTELAAGHSPLSRRQIVPKRRAEQLVNVVSTGDRSMTNGVAVRTIEVIAKQLRVDPGIVTRETHLDELGANSLQLVEIIMELEEIFDIEIDQNASEAWESLKDVGNIIDAISKLSEAKGQK
jgi:acyl carrier protein